MIPVAEGKIKTDCLILKKTFTATTSTNGNIAFRNYIDIDKYIAISVSAMKSNDYNPVICIPYMYHNGETNFGVIGGIHCISEYSSYSVIANTSLDVTIYYTERP